MQQGHSFNVPEPSEAAASQLNAVIQQEVGTLVGGERARQLLGTVKDELGRFLTETGKPRTGGPLHAAIEASADATTKRLDAETQLAALDGKLDELSRTKAIRDRAKQIRKELGNPKHIMLGVDRLDVPGIMVSDGPHGLRKQASAADHLGLTKDPAFTDNVLYLLLESPR